MATTGLPSASPSVSNAGPGPSDTEGTVTTASSTPKTTIGINATISVRIRLFTSLTLDGVVRAPGLVARRKFTGPAPSYDRVVAWGLDGCEAAGVDVPRAV